jgi:hypothetical protein
MKDDAFSTLLSFLTKLERRGISYRLAHNRDESIMVTAAAPGERWEIEFLNDGSVEVERFISNGEIFGAESLSELLARYSESTEKRQEAELVSVSTD